jgi:general stress protein 26
MEHSEKNRLIEIMTGACQHCFMATSDNHQPDIRVMTPVIEADMTIWMVTFVSSNKMKTLQVNPRVALSFTSHPGWEEEVVVLGSVEVINDLAEKQRIWKLASGDLSVYFPDGPGSEELCLLRLVPETIRCRDGYHSRIKTYTF